MAVRSAPDHAVVRLEQIYPLPGELLRDTLAAYPNAREVRWVQEEPRNMGAWPFLNERLWAAFRQRYLLSVVARPESASPASGSQVVHELEQEHLLGEAFSDATAPPGSRAATET